MNEIYGHALKLLAGRDYSTHRLCLKLEQRFETVPEDVIQRLMSEGFLDDRRFAENFIRGRIRRGRPQLEVDLACHGVHERIIREVLESENWPTAGETLRAKMGSSKLAAPLGKKDAARLYRSLERLGYDAEEILSEIEEFL